MCKLTYAQLLTMLTNANWAFEFYFSVGLKDRADRYNRIATRIREAMDNYKHVTN